MNQVNRPDSKPDAFRDLVAPDGTVIRGKRNPRAFDAATLPSGKRARGKRIAKVTP